VWLCIKDECDALLVIIPFDLVLNKVSVNRVIIIRQLNK
jgi:hypothetical protein